MAAHHTTFAFNLKHTDIKEKYTQFMKDIVIVKTSSEPCDLAFSLTTANFANALVFPLWPDAHRKLFLIGAEENASFSTPLQGSSWPEILYVCCCYCKETTLSECQFSKNNF